MMTQPHILDTSGLKCPLPVLKARKALKNVPAGTVLRVIATDPGAVQDFEAFCKTTGNRLLTWAQTEARFTFDIEKAL